MERRIDHTRMMMIIIETLMNKKKHRENDI